MSTSPFSETATREQLIETCAAFEPRQVYWEQEIENAKRVLSPLEANNKRLADQLETMLNEKHVVEVEISRVRNRENRAEGLLKTVNIVLTQARRRLSEMGGDHGGKTD